MLSLILFMTEDVPAGGAPSAYVIGPPFSGNTARAEMAEPFSCVPFAVTSNLSLVA
jgi:hypothetical protein